MDYNITLIAALDPHRVIGYKNQMPWYIPEDLKHFKSLTKDHYVVMGKNTFDSLDQKPLPNRVNIVLSQTYYRDPPYLENQTFFVPSIETVLKIFGHEELKVIGGQQIYEQFLPLANFLDLTHVHQQYLGDTYFPDYKDDFELISEEVHKTFSYCRYQRRLPLGKTSQHTL
jgi:dihydrofolate reductase